MYRLAAALLGLSLVNTPLFAQRITPVAYTPTLELPEDQGQVRPVAPDRRTPAVSAPAMAFAGLLGGAIGMFGGGLIGYSMKSCGSEEWFCGMGEAAVGAIVGEVVMLPYGVHASSKHSLYATKLILSVVTAGVGALAAPATDGASILAVPPVQLILIIAGERAAARRNAHSNQEKGQ